MAIGNPNGIPFCWEPPVKTASDIESSPNLRISADGGVSEFSNGCLDGRVFSLVQASPVGVLPSLLVVPQSYKSGKLYAQLPNARVNHIPNNSMFGASGGVIPSGWTFSIGAASGVSLGYSASGQVTAEDGTLVDYIDFTFSGTATASGFLNLRPNASPSTISSVSGQSWNASVYFQLISGSVASISPTYQLQETTSGGTFIDGSNITGLGSLTTSLPLRRYNVTRDLNTSGTVVTCRWGHSIVSGTSYNYILRIASPQLENLSSPTSVIRTVSGAVYAPYSGAAPGGSTIASIADFTVSRNTTATRVNSSGLIESVASGVPRIDWLGQSCPALLVEASGQNLALQSEAFNVSGTWSRNLGGTGLLPVVTANSVISPDGGQTAETVVFDRGAGNTVSDRSFLEQSFTILTSGTYTFSVYAKASASGDIGKQVFIRIGSTGTLTAITLTANWVRYSRAETSLASGSQGVQIGNRGTITADNSVSVDLWGAQVETGSVATTYIPTTSGTGSRAADVISASGALVSGLIGQTEGTIYAEVDYKSIATTKSIIAINDGTANNRIQVRFASTTVFNLRIVIGGVDNDYNVTISPALSASGSFKVALAYKQNDYVLAVNGSLYASTASRNVPACTNLILGNSGFTSEFLNDRIRAAALYTTRLSNAQLAELTRL